MAAVDGKTIVARLQELAVGACIQLDSKDNSLEDDWRTATATRQPSGWSLKDLDQTDKEVIILDDDESESLLNPDFWTVGW